MSPTRARSGSIPISPTTPNPDARKITAPLSGPSGRLTKSNLLIIRCSLISCANSITISSSLDEDMSLSSSSYLNMYAFCRGFLTTQPALIPKRRGPPRVQIDTNVESCPTCQTPCARSLRLSDLELPNLIDTVQRSIVQTVRSNVRMHHTPDNLPSDYRVGSSQHCYATRHLMTDIGKKPSSIAPLLHKRKIPIAQAPTKKHFPLFWDVILFFFMKKVPLVH